MQHRRILHGSSMDAACAQLEYMQNKFSIKKYQNVLYIMCNMHMHREFFHENLINFHGICHQENHLLIVTDPMPGG